MIYCLWYQSSHLTKILYLPKCKTFFNSFSVAKTTKFADAGVSGSCCSWRRTTYIFSVVAHVNKYSFLPCPLWIYNLSVTPVLGNSDDFQDLGLDSMVSASLKQPAASLSNPGSSYCCWQLTPAPSNGGIRWEWVRRSKGTNQRRPLCVPRPKRELLIVADSKK